jgi:hypothetical protein
MEQNDSRSDLLKKYFRSKLKEETLQRAVQIRALQQAAKKQPIGSITFPRFLTESLKAARLNIGQLQDLAGIEPLEAKHLSQEVVQNPFTLRASSVVSILLTFNLSLKNLQILLENSIIAGHALSQSERAVARSSEVQGSGERARSIRDGLDALFIQLNEKRAKEDGGPHGQLLPEEQARLSEYLSRVAEELRRREADYLIS